MRTANLFLIGAPKSGTTSLASWLAEHPDIYWSVPKEPYFWAEDFPGMRSHYGFGDRAAYDGLFAGPEAAAATWRGDGSTTYLYSQAAVPAILAAIPDARFLVCLRRPDELVPSYHRTQITALNEQEHDLERAWRRSVSGAPVPGTPLDAKLLDYPMVGRLGAATARVAELVPPGHLELVLFDDLASAPVDTYRRVLTFLGVDQTELPELEVRNASNNAARFPALRRITHRPPAWLEPSMARLRQWSRTTELPGVRKLKGSLWQGAERPTITPELRAELRDFFADDVRQLEVTLGRELPGWRHDSHDPNWSPADRG